MPSWRVGAGAPSGIGMFDPRRVCLIGFPLQTTNDAIVQLLVRNTYTVNNLFLYVTANTSPDRTITVVSRKNGVNASLTLSIAPGTTGIFEDVVNSDSLVDGDGYNAFWSYSAGSGSATFSVISCVFTSDNPQPPLASMLDQSRARAVSSTFFLPIVGSVQDVASPTVEARAQVRFATAATLSNLRIYLSANGISDASTLTLRVNSNNGNQTVSITGSTTGAFEDTTNTDSIVASDLVCVTLVTGATGTTLSAWMTSLKSNSTRRQTAAAAHSQTSLGSGLTRYSAMEGGVTSLSATEANAQVTMRISAEMKNFFANIPSNSLNGASTIKSRKNGADGGLSISVGAATTGQFQDTVGSDTLTATDEYNYQLITGGTAGGMQPCSIGVEAGDTGVAAVVGRGLIDSLKLSRRRLA